VTNLKTKEPDTKMKGFNEYGDLIAMSIGTVGAFLKGLKQKLKFQSLMIACLVAGILTYGATGVIEFFYNDLPPKLIILISFAVGWVTNEITHKLDELVGDLYEFFIGWITGKTRNKKKEENENNG
jgi:uncharacterized membrane protein YeaQ/YmgE (transglycosylase-associated protein family)